MVRRGDLIPAVVTLSVGLVLSGCVATAPAHSAVPVASPAASATPRGSTVTPAPPRLRPSGTASQNLAYFNLVGHRLLDNNSPANSDGRAIVDAYVAAGFPKSQMEVTPDKTSIGLAAWNIEFAVRMNGGCLIGQAGNVGFQSFVAPVLATGRCLIGTTRPIDW